jgi:hypothetical protein
MATGTFRSRVPVFFGVSGEHQASPLRTAGALETSRTVVLWDLSLLVLSAVVISRFRLPGISRRRLS